MFEEMTMKPAAFGFAGWKEVTTSVPLGFPGCKKNFRFATPFLLGGYWHWDMLEIGAKSGVLVPVPVGAEPIDQAVEMYETHDTSCMIYKFGGDAAAMAICCDVISKVHEQVVDKTKFKFIQIDMSAMFRDGGLAYLRLMRAMLPGTVLIVGPAYTLSQYHDYYRAGADAVVLSCPTYAEHLGIGVNARELLATCKEKAPIIADFDMSTNAEIIKCLALGADLVTIGPSMGNIMLEDLVMDLKKACAFTGFSSVESFFPLLIG